MRGDRQAWPERLYGLLAEDEDARVCRDIPEAACNEQPRSYFFQLAALILTKFGDALVSPRLVLAWMLSALAAPAMFIAMLLPLREALALLPQLVVAQYLRERPVRKGFWVAGSVGQAAALVGMAVAVMIFEGAALGWSVIGTLAVFSLSRGVCSVTAKDVLGKTVSKTRRGRLNGQSASAAGAATLLAAVGVAVLASVAPSRELFFLLLIAGSVLWLLAAVLYAAIPEQPGATEGGGNALAEAWRSLSLLARDRRFAAFVRARALLVATAFAIPYIVVIIQRHGNGGVLALAAMLFASGLAGFVAAPFWGRLADRAANRVMAMAALLSVMVMLAVLLASVAVPAWLGNVFLAGGLLFLANVAHQGARVARKTYLVDMARQETRARYVAVSNTVIGLVLLAGSLLGWLDSAFGAGAVLLLLGFIGLIAVISCWRLPNVSG